MKKILILTSSGGGGTLSASTSIEEYLKNDYTITTKHVFNELLKSVDICSKLTLKKYSCEDIYNLFIPKKQFRALTLLYYFGRWYIQLRKKAIRSILRDYLIKNRPSVIISVIPIINNIILSIAQELDIPFLIIPTDLDVNMYILNIKKPSYKNFHISLPFQDNQLMTPLQKASIPAEQISVIGAPLRSDFFTPKDTDLLKKKFNIPLDKPIIMVLMGAQGSAEIEKYINQFIKIKQPLHLIICTGKKNTLLSNIKLPDHITMSVIKFTSRIADLMSLSDIIFTKSGTLSVCEAIYMNTPLILDATSTVLPWEKLNHQFITTHQLGISITHYSQIAPVFSSLLNQPHTITHYKNNLQQLHKNNIEIEIKKCIRNMLN